MFKNCIIFTSQYPFSSLEPFLENEMKYLYKVFDSIFVFTLSSSDETKVQTPKNVYSFCLNLTNVRFKKIKKLWLGFFHNIIPIKKKKISDKLVCWYVRGNAYLAYKKVLQIIKNHNISVDDTLFYSYWLNDSAIVGSLIKRHFSKSDITFISRAHGSDLYSHAHPWNFNPFQEFVLENVDYVYSISTNGAKYLKDKYPQQKDKIKFSRLGTNGPSILETKNCFNPKIIVSCSNLIPLKRVDLIAKSINCIINKGYDVEWHCFGDGPDFNRITEICKDNIFSGKIKMFGRKTNSFILNHYKNTLPFLFVNLSTTEGVPVSIMEAMSFGIPCLATDVGGTSELVDNYCGMLIEPNTDAQFVCNCIEDFLKEDPSIYSNRRVLSYNKWNKLYNAQTNYNSWVNELSNLKK